MSEVQTSQHEPATILAQFYDAETRYMQNPSDELFKQMVATFSPDLKLIQSPDLPYGGVWYGLDGFRGWSEQMASYFDVVDVQKPEVFTRDGSDRVMVLGLLHLRLRRSQRVLEAPMCQMMVVDRDAGLITEIQPFYWNVKGLVDAIELDKTT